MKKILLLLLFLIILLFTILFIKIKNKEENLDKNINDKLMIDLKSYDIDSIKKFADDNNLNLIINEVYSDDYEKDEIINQNIQKNHKYKSGDQLIIDIVIGNLNDKKLQYSQKYTENNVNELGRVPIMMYHGIHNKKNNETEFIGGNVDKDGYQRTAEAFRNDLEFYYQNGYRMIRLTDYIDGKIDVEFGKSPIIITFDDGLQNNINVLGIDEKGEIIIDPNCAIGILEEFKKKYPDFNVTATFFVNLSLFNQKEYNEKIINWLVKNGYDIGNHTATHPDFTKIDSSSVGYQVGSVYEKLNEIIPNKYVNIVALPFGSPYKQNHPNFEKILNCSYNGKEYTTKTTLRVGWESDYSPFSSNFDSTFIKRIRAYDNNGLDFDIEYNFKILQNNRYISDGDINTIVIKDEDKDLVKNTYNLDVITY